MKNNINYITNLPDFITMQRTSFCWFISKGLTEELSLFSRIYDFSQNTEYVLFGEEYSLIKPPCSLVIARKYSGNYRAQLVIPIEVRNKKINTILCHNQFPVITLPLMTTSATFILNGCERVIVSQIIRSPGVYFERNKNQKKHHYFKRKLSTEIGKLRTFLPSGEAFISESDLFFPLPIPKIDPITGEKKMIPAWNHNLLFSYSINFLKQKEQNLSFYFLQSFKLYRIISQEINSAQKKKLIQFFFKWLKIFNTLSNTQSHFEKTKIKYLLTYFNLLLRFIVKYQILNNNLKTRTQPFQSFVQVSFSKFSNDFPVDYQNQELINIYDKTLLFSQIGAQIELNKNLILITQEPTNWLYQLQDFSFLKRTIQKLNQQLELTYPLITSKELRPIIYFSKSLKDQLKYVFKKKKKLVIVLNDINI